LSANDSTDPAQPVAYLPEQRREGNGNPRCLERNATTWELVCRIGTQALR
jgi:hypothetical protein